MIELVVNALTVLVALALSFIVFVFGILAAIFSQGCGALCSDADHPSLFALLVVLTLWAVLQYGVYRGSRFVLDQVGAFFDSRFG